MMTQLMMKNDDIRRDTLMRVALVLINLLGLAALYFGVIAPS